MATGYRVGAGCVSDFGAVASTYAPAVSASGLVRVEADGNSPSGYSLVHYSSPPLQEVGRSFLTDAGWPQCDPAEAFSDGLSVGWGVAVALALVWGIRLMARAAR